MSSPNTDTPIDEECLYCKARPVYLAFPNVRDSLGIDADSYSFYACPNCGSLRLVPMPPAEVSMQAYPRDYCFSVSDSGRTLSHFLESLQHRFLYKPMYEAQVRLVLENLPFKAWESHRSVLDVGCGKADRLRVFAKSGFNVCGLDLVPENVSWVKQSLGIPAICGDAETISHYFAAKSFSIITAFALLEHLRKPASFVKQCFELLKRSGAFVALVPIADSVWVRIFRRRWGALTEAPRHVSLPSRSGLRILLQDAGYEEVVILPDTITSCAGTVGISAFPKGRSYFHKRGFLSYRFLAILASLLAIPLVITERWVGRCGANVIAIARRPASD